MGTSLEQIDHSYGHFAPDSEAHELLLLDAYDGNLIGHALVAEEGKPHGAEAA